MVFAAEILFFGILFQVPEIITDHTYLYGSGSDWLLGFFVVIEQTLHWDSLYAWFPGRDSDVLPLLSAILFFSKLQYEPILFRWHDNQATSSKFALAVKYRLVFLFSLDPWKFGSFFHPTDTSFAFALTVKQIYPHSIGSSVFQLLRWHYNQTTFSEFALAVKYCLVFLFLFLSGSMEVSAPSWIWQTLRSCSLWRKVDVGFLFSQIHERTHSNLPRTKLHIDFWEEDLMDISTLLFNYRDGSRSKRIVVLSENWSRTRLMFFRVRSRRIEDTGTRQKNPTHDIFVILLFGRT